MTQGVTASVEPALKLLADDAGTCNADLTSVVEVHFFKTLEVNDHAVIVHRQTIDDARTGAKGQQAQTRADGGHASVVKTWEDAPFYARSMLASRLYGEPVTAVQESLDLDRFASPVVQFMLPYRMPRSV